MVQVPRDGGGDPEVRPGSWRDPLQVAPSSLLPLPLLLPLLSHLQEFPAEHEQRAAGVHRPGQGQPVDQAGGGAAGRQGRTWRRAATGHPLPGGRRKWGEGGG